MNFQDQIRGVTMMAINWMHKNTKVDIAIQKAHISNIHPT
jgi:hypothetical protein